MSPDPTPRHLPTIAERRRREKRIWWIGLALSVLAHVVVFASWPTGTIPVEPQSAAGPGAADPVAGSGGMEAVNLRPPVSLPSPPPPVVQPAVEAVQPPPLDRLPSVDPADLLGERPGLEEPGGATGTGRGARGSTEAGTGRVVPPSPRSMILPPSDSDLRGSEVSVWVFVDERGQVVSDSTRLEPPTRKGDFNRRLIEEASEWVFEPARRDGEPVPAWFPYTIRM